jgi:ArsR family transcriptional regulator
MNDLPALVDHLKLLGDRTRLRLLALIREEELSVGELSEILSQRQSTVSSQLSRLREAGMVLDRREGTRSFYRFPSDRRDELWELITRSVGDDPVLGKDRERLDQVLLERRGGNWLDQVAGSLDRRWVPGRSFASLTFGLSLLLDLGVCLDMGSGDGALLSLLAPAADRLICLDSHPRMVQMGRKRALDGGHPNVLFLRADMQNVPLKGGTMDTVFLLQSLQYARDPQQVLQEAGRLTRPGGRCLVVTLETHEDQRICEEYGHVWQGFEKKDLVDWMNTAGFMEQRHSEVSADPRANHLMVLSMLGEKQE